MHPMAPPTELTPKDRVVPPCIAALLHVVRKLLGYGRNLDDNIQRHAVHPRFPALAAGFGTHDVRRILLHIQRGILKAMMLERFLLARAAEGRDIDPKQPPSPAEPAEIAALEMKLRRPSAEPRVAPAQKIDPTDPMHFSMPTTKELESQVRRQPVGQTIAEICLDLGITPSGCDGATWNEILQTLMHFGADLAAFFGVRTRRRALFQKERDTRPESWDVDWRDDPREAIREVLGYLVGEPLPAACLAGVG